MATQSTIELNGKVYDAHSGRPLNTSKRSTFARSIDGVRRAPTSASQVLKVKPPAAKKISHDKPHALARAAQRLHGRQQKAKVLNRRGVKKPVAVVKSAVTEVPKSSVIEQTRSLRAKAIHKSEQISRFASSVGPARVKAVPVAPVAVAKPVTAAAISKPKPTAPKPITKKDQLLKDGVEKAQSHREKAPKSRSKKSRKRLLYATVAIVTLVILGYVGYVNIPNIKMKYASARAGFSAGLPSYSPSGYHLIGPTSFEQGQITIGYQSNTDNRQYKIAERKSNWDSESLLTNFVSQKNNVQTSRERGLTIYLYDGSNAAWVNNGIWYTIEGDSALSSQQITKIAASL